MIEKMRAEENIQVRKRPCNFPSPKFSNIVLEASVIPPSNNKHNKNSEEILNAFAPFDGLEKFITIIEIIASTIPTIFKAPGTSLKNIIEIEIGTRTPNFENVLDKTTPFFLILNSKNKKHIK